MKDKFGLQISLIMMIVVFATNQFNTTRVSELWMITTSPCKSLVGRLTESLRV
jgi:hypothetical protein